MLDLDRYFAGQAARRSMFEGQLEPAFQKALTARFDKVPTSECTFTLTTSLVDNQTIAGEYDIRGMERAVLGDVRFWGRRVVEFIPGSGWISAYIEPRAKELVTIDTPLLPPASRADVHAQDADGLAEREKSAWWFTKQALGHDAYAIYAPPHDPPADLGRFDIAVLVHALSRTRHPYKMLEAAADIVDECIIVTEPVPTTTPVIHNSPAVAPVVYLDSSETPAVIFLPPRVKQEAPRWQHTQAAVEFMLVSLGFRDQVVTYHAPKQLGVPTAHFTICARR